MGAISEHHIQQDHRRLGIPGLFENAFIAQSVIDHRMGTPAREDVVAEIDDRMPPAGPDVLQAVFGIHRSV